MTSMKDTIRRAMQTHWVDTPYAHGPVEDMARAMLRHFSLVCGKGLILDELSLEDITEERIEAFKAVKRAHGVSNSTINKYLSCLSVLFDVAGVPKPTIKRLPEKRVEKWWLTPERYDNLMHYLMTAYEAPQSTPGEYQRRVEFRFLVQIMVEAGLRVSEVLALKQSDLDFNEVAIKVPGTKTAGAEATIPASENVMRTLAQLARWARSNRRQALFTITYDEARKHWQHCREWLGLSDMPTATLKALRRTFAANATKAGMPTAVLQRVMRHENIATTEGYLRLTGGGLAEEARKYLNNGKRVENYQLQRDAAEKAMTMLVLDDLEDTSSGPSSEAVKKWADRFEGMVHDSLSFRVPKGTTITPKDLGALHQAYLKVLAGKLTMKENDQ